VALSTHPGGSADKAGFVHEALWGIRALLFVLDGEAASITIETPGDDGAEFHLQRDDTREHWQAKRQVTGQDTWSLQRLKTDGVLAFFFEKFRQGERCVFASVSDAPELRMLSENAAINGSLERFKTHFLDQKRRAQFNDLRDHVGASSDDEAFSFLRSLTVHGGREITLEPMLGYMIGVAFQGTWQNTMAVLRDLYLKSSHETLTAIDIEKHLLRCGIVRRRVGTPNACDRVRDVTKAYVAGQRAKLIRGALIRRTVADDIVGKVQNSSASLDIFVTSAAGGGKSACLLQIVEGLQVSGVPVLAFRLDRIEPVRSPILLGEKLGLGESPALVLAEAYPKQPIVIVIDQLDFVSTTSGRHSDFFDTLAALRDEVVGLRSKHQIHLVLACRKFDFEHDHRLKQLTTKGQPPVALGEFTDQEVRAVLQSEGGDFAKLTAKQQSMLRLPQNLSLFVDARLARTENRFTTPKELCDAYWTEKRKAVAAQRTDFGQHWLPSIQHLASTMSDRQEMSVPVGVMDAFPPEFLQKMASEGVLTADGKRFGFGHETFFDYCFARTLPNGGRDFVSFLENDAQHLFRRGQLRQVLAFLRDDDSCAYLARVENLLRSDRIRPHLKLLVVELMAAHPQVSEQELEILMPWIVSEIESRRKGNPNADKLATRIWDRFFASRTLFDVVDRMGFINGWLQSGESWLQDTMMHYLRWQTEEHADRIAELLEPFVPQAEWRDRLRFMMEGRNLEKSRRFFNLFLRLLAAGTLDDARDRFASNGTFWMMLDPLAEQRPDWCAELAATWLDRRVTIAKGAESAEGRLSAFNDGFGVDDLFKSARGDPHRFLEHVLPAVLRAAGAFAYNIQNQEFPRDQLWPFRIQGEYISMLEAFPSACETAIQLLGQASPDVLRTFVDQLRAPRLYTANQLLLHAYLSNPAAYADEVIHLLADEPQRLSCGYSDSSYWTARQVIGNCSAHCSKEAFDKLEAVVLAFVSPFECTPDGARWAGNAAYNLISSMDDARMGDVARAQTAAWKATFKKPDGPPVGIRSYTVGSPIEEEAATQMTDDEWLRVISEYNTDERRHDFEHPERGGALELARMLQKFTEAQPERFATLAALQFPDDSHPLYFAHVLRGLKTAEIPFDKKLSVARRVFGIDQHDCFQSALSVLATINNAELPQDAIEYIIQTADNDDPTAELWDGDKPYFGGDILTAGINSVRGYVAEAIRDLVFTHGKYLPIFTATIQKLVNDPNLGVRSCVASTLQAVRYRDTPLAVGWCDVLFDADDRLLRTPYAQDLIHGGLRTDLERFAPVVKRMLGSAHDKVREAGGLLACLARLYHERADSLSEVALAGDEHCRLGACEVAKSNLLQADCRAWCESALVRLFVDASQEIRAKAAGCFWHLWHSPETPLTDFDALILDFLMSPAFVSEPTYLLHALEETKHKVPEATLDVCEVFISRCSEDARDMRTSLAGDEHIVGKLVFTSYAQLLSPALQARALGVIDQMSLEGLNSATTHLAEFER
jgi:hypothetical protein